MRIWLGGDTKGRKNKNVGVLVYDDEDIDVRKVIEVVQEGLTKNFPDAEIVEAPSVKRELFGERD
jgi:hypothetical protein